jgi:hypothetical protein
LATLAAFFLLLTVVCPILVLGCVGFLALIGLLLDVLLIEPVAWLLERDKLDRWIKLFAFILLITGFHFDFLAT